MVSQKKIIKENPNYKHFNTDIRNYKSLEKIFKIYKKNVSLIIHCLRLLFPVERNT